MKKSFILSLALLVTTTSVFAIENTQEKKSWFKFGANKNEVKLEKTKKTKRVEVAEIELPAVVSFKNGYSVIVGNKSFRAVIQRFLNTTNLTVTLFF